MGIKGLTSFLKRKFPNVFDIVPISSFKNKTIAVDATLVVCCNKSKTNMLESLHKFLKIFVNNDIKIVLVFDGKSPEEKTREKTERKNKRKAARELADSLKRDIDEYESFNVASELLLSTMERIKKRKNIPDISLEDILLYVKSLRKRSESVTKEDIQEFKWLAGTMNIPIVEAEGEAEIKCAKMARRGTVHAIYTCDTDALACLTPLTIFSITGTNFKCVRIAKLLKCLKMDQQSFVDFCISCGTDFNKNITGYGPNKMYNLIKVHGNLESLETILPGIKNINYERIRKIFDCDRQDKDMTEDGPDGPDGRDGRDGRD